MEIMPNNISQMQEESSSQLSEDKSFASPVVLTGPLLSFDECQRVKAVNRLRILDTNQSDENFDRLSRLASRHFETPAACISIIDNNRIWMKSIVGLDVSEVNFDPLVECKAAVFERLKAFCSHTIHPNAPEVFMIENAADDPVFSKISSVCGDAHIQFYAGAPIVCDCMKIGTVSVLDDHPRPDFDEVKKETLRLFSEVAASLIKQCRPETIVDVDTTVHRVDSVILKGLKEPLENLHVLNNQLTGSIENSLASKSDISPVEATDDTEVLTAFEKFEDGIHQWQAITNASLQFALAVTQLEGPSRPHRHGCSEIPSGERTSPPSVKTATIRSLHSAVSSTSGELPIVATESGSLTDFYRSLIGKCEELRQLHKVVEWSAPEPERLGTAEEQPAQQHQQYLAIDYDIFEREDDLGDSTIDSKTFEGTIAAVIGYLSLMNFRQFNAISITVRVHFADPANYDGTETAYTSNRSSSFETTSRSSSPLKRGDHWEVLAGEEPLDSFSDDRIGVFGEDRGSQDSQKHVEHIFTRSSDLDSGLGLKSRSSLTSTSSGNPDSRITSGIGDHFSMGIGIQFQDRSTKSNQSAFNQQEFQDEYGDEAEQWRLLEALVDSLGGDIEAGAENASPLTDRGSRTFRLMFSNILHWKRLSEQESFVAPCTSSFGSGPHL